jgi:hypothetical protein
MRVWRLVHRRRCTLHRLSSYDSIQLEDTVPEAEFGQIRYSSDRERKEAVFAELESLLGRIVVNICQLRRAC